MVGAGPQLSAFSWSSTEHITMVDIYKVYLTQSIIPAWVFLLAIPNIKSKEIVRLEIYQHVKMSIDLQNNPEFSFSNIICLIQTAP